MLTFLVQYRARNRTGNCLLTQHRGRCSGQLSGVTLGSRVVVSFQVEGEIVISYPSRRYQGDLTLLVISLVVAQRGNSVWQDLGGTERQLPKWRSGLCLAHEHKAILGVVL